MKCDTEPWIGLDALVRYQNAEHVPTVAPISWAVKARDGGLKCR